MSGPDSSTDSLTDLLPDATVRYASHGDALLDVHLPPESADGPVPLLVLVHGGFWRVAYDRRHTRPLAAAFAREGFVVVTPEYRRVGGSGTEAGGWPATFEDVDAALSAVPSLLPALGVRLSVGSTTVAGHSAGGHLALWLANQTHPVDRVVGLAPVGDLRAAARDRLGDGAAQALLGGEPDEVPDRYDAADPGIRLSRRPACDVVVVHGTEDVEVPVGNSRGLAAAHPHVDLRELPGADHFALMDPSSPAWRSVLAAVRGDADAGNDRG